MRLDDGWGWDMLDTRLEKRMLARCWLRVLRVTARTAR